MKTASLLGMLFLSGALGAAAGGAVAALADAPAPERDTALLDRLDRLTDGIDDIRASSQESRAAVADLGERLIAVELELSRRAAQPTPAARDPEETANAAPERVNRRLPPATPSDVADMEQRVRDMELAASAASEQAKRMQATFAKSMELRALPEAERWEKIADDLGLNSVQVDELQAAEAAYREARKAATTEETRTSDGGAEITMRTIDGEKMRGARDEFDRRVDTALNDEQKKAWSEGGYRRAVGGGPTIIRSAGGIRVRSSGSGDDTPSTGTVIIETETLRD